MAEAIAILFLYPKGDKGDPLTWEDMTDEQKAELSQSIAEIIIPALSPVKVATFSDMVTHSATVEADTTYIVSEDESRNYRKRSRYYYYKEENVFDWQVTTETEI